MKITVQAAVFAVLLAAAPALAEMMNQAQEMMQQQQESTQQQNSPSRINPGMRGGYGQGYNMGPGMMGGYGMGPACGNWQNPWFKSREDYEKFMEDTREQRQKLHNLMFEYGEARRSQEPDRKKLQKMEEEMDELRNQIFNSQTK